MIKYKDFFPRKLQDAKPAKFLSGPIDAQYESFADAVQAANEWVEARSLEVINIETVVLPNIWEELEEGTEDVDIKTFNAVHWHQFVRCWYRT